MAAEQQNPKKEDSSVKKKTRSQATVKDKVAAEYDVFLTQGLTQNLNLFQFPLRPAWLPLEKESVAGLRMKPKHHKFELETHLNTAPEHYNPTKFGGLQTLQLTSQPVPLQTNLAVGVIRNGEIHLTPLQQISRFKPSLSHLTKEGVGEELMPVEETSVLPADAQHEQSFRPKQLQVKRRDAPRRAPSQAALRKEEEEEPWVDLEYHDFSDTPDNALFDQLFAANRFEIPFDMGKRDYLQLLARPEVSVVGSAQLGKVGIDISVVEGGIEGILQDLFTKHQFISFQTIFSVLQKAPPSGTEPLTETSVKELLQERCISLHGGYVLRIAGDEALAKDRDAILKVFQLNKQAKRSDFNTMARHLYGQTVAPSAYKKIVSELAVFNGSVWVLRDPA